MQNRHPADRLADVRSEIKRLEAEETKLRAYLLEHPQDRIGEEHIVVVGSQSRKRVAGWSRRAPGPRPVVQPYAWLVLHLTLFVRATDHYCSQSVGLVEGS